MNGEKGMLTEGGIRIPFIVYWKGKIPGGQVYAKPVISLDVAATANALAGLPKDPGLDGINLMPYLTGQDSDAPHDVLFWRWSGQFAVRKGDWKYLTSGTRQYLFNLADDPEEHHDLLKQRPDVATSLRSQLEQWSQTLIPAGFDEPKISAPSSSYFDYYLDGKMGPTVSSKNRKKSKGRAQVAADSDDERGNLVKLFDQRDKDNDSRVTLDEFIAKRTGATVPTLARRFKEFDRNSDGAWTIDEIVSPSKSKDVDQ